MQIIFYVGLGALIIYALTAFIPLIKALIAKKKLKKIVDEKRKEKENER